MSFKSSIARLFEDAEHLKLGRATRLAVNNGSTANVFDNLIAKALRPGLQEFSESERLSLARAFQQIERGMKADNPNLTGPQVYNNFMRSLSTEFAGNPTAGKEFRRALLQGLDEADEVRVSHPRPSVSAPAKERVAATPAAAIREATERAAKETEDLRIVSETSVQHIVSQLDNVYLTRGKIDASQAFSQLRTNLTALGRIDNAVRANNPMAAPRDIMLALKAGQTINNQEMQTIMRFFELPEINSLRAPSTAPPVGGMGPIANAGSAINAATNAFDRLVASGRSTSPSSSMRHIYENGFDVSRRLDRLALDRASDFLRGASNNFGRIALIGTGFYGLAIAPALTGNLLNPSNPGGVGALWYGIADTLGGDNLLGVGSGLPQNTEAPTKFAYFNLMNNSKYLQDQIKAYTGVDLKISENGKIDNKDSRGLYDAVNRVFDSGTRPLAGSTYGLKALRYWFEGQIMTTISESHTPEMIREAARMNIVESESRALMSDTTESNTKRQELYKKLGINLPNERSPTAAEILTQSSKLTTAGLDGQVAITYFARSLGIENPENATPQQVVEKATAMARNQADVAVSDAMWSGRDAQAGAPATSLTPAASPADPVSIKPPELRSLFSAVAQDDPNLKTSMSAIMADFETATKGGKAMTRDQWNGLMNKYNVDPSTVAAVSPNVFGR